MASTTFTQLLLLLMLLGTQFACSSAEEELAACTSSSDCYSNEVCHRSRCTLWSSPGDAPASPGDDHSVQMTGDMYALPPGPRSGEPGDMGTAAVDQQGTSDETVRRWPDTTDPNYTTAQGQPDQGHDVSDMTHEPDQEAMPSNGCDGAMPPLPGEFVLNEVLMNVPTGDEGDANADGTRDAYDDEFVELVNASNETLLLAGVQLLVNDNLRHAFAPDLCLSPGEAVVLFSGPRDRPMIWREGVLFMAPQSKLGLNNSAGKIELWDAQDRVLFSLSYEDARKTSYVLWPELTGTVFLPHDTVSDTLFSPGRCADATALQDGCISSGPPPSQEGDMDDADLGG